MRVTTAILAAANRKRTPVTSLVVAIALLISGSGTVAIAAVHASMSTPASVQAAEQGHGKDPVFVPAAGKKPVNKDGKAKPKPKSCRNDLAITLKQVGFKGQNLKEAWAIAMRESRGKPRVISSTWDVGLFQFNRAAHSKQDWWDVEKLRTARYSAKVAYEMSDGGRTWYPWGLDGKGNVKAHVYRNIGWSDARIQSHIVAPYEKWVKEFKKLPASCR